MEHVPHAFHRIVCIGDDRPRCSQRILQRAVDGVQWRPAALAHALRPRRGNGDGCGRVSVLIIRMSGAVRTLQSQKLALSSWPSRSYSSVSDQRGRNPVRGRPVHSTLDDLRVYHRATFVHRA